MEAVYEKEQRAALLQRCHSEWKQAQNQQVFKTNTSHKFFLDCFYVNLIQKHAQKKIYTVYESSSFQKSCFSALSVLL